MAENFEDLGFIIGLIKEHKEIGFHKTIQDLERTWKVIVGKNKDLDKKTVSSWWDDYSFQDFDLMRYYLGYEREDKVKEYTFPKQEVIEGEIFPSFVNVNIREYLQKRSNQHNFKDAARTEIKLRMMLAGLISEADDRQSTIFELRANSDGDEVIAIEMFDLPRLITNLTLKEDYVSKGLTPATIKLVSKIKLVDDEIIHEVIDFNIEVKDIEVCREIFSLENLTGLKKYMSEIDRRAIESVNEGWVEISSDEFYTAPNSPERLAELEKKEKGEAGPAVAENLVPLPALLFRKRNDKLHDGYVLNEMEISEEDLIGLAAFKF